MGSKRRATLLPLSGRRFLVTVSGDRPTVTSLLLIYGKSEKMSRFKGVKLALKRVKKWVKTRGRILRFEGVFFKENFKVMVLYTLKKVKRLTGLKKAQIRRRFIFKGFQRFGFKTCGAVLKGFKGGFKGYLKNGEKIAIFSKFHCPIFGVLKKI